MWWGVMRQRSSFRSTKRALRSPLSRFEFNAHFKDAAGGDDIISGIHPERVVDYDRTAVIWNERFQTLMDALNEGMLAERGGSLSSSSPESGTSSAVGIQISGGEHLPTVKIFPSEGVMDGKEKFSSTIPQSEDDMVTVCSEHVLFAHLSTVLLRIALPRQRFC